MPTRRDFLRRASTGALAASGALASLANAATHDPKGQYDPRGHYDPRGGYDPRRDHRTGDYDPRGDYRPPQYDPRHAADAPGPDQRQPQVVYHVLGKTSLSVSHVAFDCSGLSFANRSVVEDAIDRGINTLYLAPGRPGGLEVCRVLRDVLARRRDRILLILESEPFEPHLDRWLRELRTDHAEVLLAPVSSVADVRQPVRLTRFRALQRKGKARFLGFNCFGGEVDEMILAAAKLEPTSVLCVPYPLAARNDLDRFLAWARRQKIGTIVRGAVAGPAGKAENVVPALRDVYRRGVADTTLIPFRSHVELQAFLRVAAPERVQRPGPTLQTPGQ
jgi:aryl-alcohol dehydrogenase-like predicted oxidoreductase